jgi:fimbrial chaperone protein
MLQPTKIRLSIALIACLFSAFMNIAYSQQISISPLRINFSGNQQSEVITLRNTSATTFTVQPKIMKWSQVDGKDVFEPTREVLVAPPFAEILGGESQVIRFALRRAPSATEELSYRVFLQQVAAPQRATGAAVTFAWNLSLPIFVAPSTELPAPELTVVAKAVGSNIELSISNSGASHVQVKNLKLESSVATSTGGQMAYLLAGQSGKFIVPAPAGKSDRLKMIADTDVGEIRRELVLQ